LSSIVLAVICPSADSHHALSRCWYHTPGSKGLCWHVYNYGPCVGHSGKYAIRSAHAHRL